MARPGFHRSAQALPGLLASAAALVASLCLSSPAEAAETTRIDPAAIVANMKGLIPHRAVYDVTLARQSDGGSIARAEGRIVYEFKGSTCAGFTTEYRFVTRFEPETGPQKLTDLRTSSFENGDGTSFDFLNQSYVNSALTEESSGRANRKDATVTVDLTKPKAEKATLPGEILFPTQHLAALIAAAERGDQVVNLKLYDGTESGHKISLASTVIGKEIAPGTVPADEPSAKAAELATMRSWPMTVSYYDADKPANSGEAVSDYQLSFVAYENGVTRQMRLNFGDFILDGHMTAFTPLATTPCP